MHVPEIKQCLPITMSPDKPYIQYTIRDPSTTYYEKITVKPLLSGPLRELKKCSLRRGFRLVEDGKNNQKSVFSILYNFLRNT